VALASQSIKNTFDVFDMETSGTVDVRELGALVRNLGVFPQVSIQHDPHGTLELAVSSSFACACYDTLVEHTRGDHTCTCDSKRAHARTC
jgi:hypothetical protein